MSVVKDHIIVIDQADFEYTGVLYVSGWYTVTSADTASVLIEDVNKAQAIRGVSVITNERMISGPPLAEPVRIKNLKVITWTNIERVVIFVDRFAAD